jgi:hypothetical protein
VLATFVKIKVWKNYYNVLCNLFLSTWVSNSY